jgi:hypothetical protein
MESRRVTAPESLGAIHVHSDYSHDGRDSLEDIRSWALARGIRLVGLSDHAEDFTGERFSEFVARCGALSDEQVSLVPGLEFRFAGFSGLHLLAIGLRSWITPSTPAEFGQIAPDVAALTILAHPGLARYRIPDNVREGIGAVEVWNGAYNTRYLPDPAAMRLVSEWRRDRPDLIGTVGLDQHDRRNDRELRVVLPGGGVDQLVALREGRFMNRGRTMTIAPDCAWSPWRLTTLTAARTAFDGVERSQQGIVQWWRRTRRRGAGLA